MLKWTVQKTQLYGAGFLELRVVEKLRRVGMQEKGRENLCFFKAHHVTYFHLILMITAKED